MLGVHYNDSDRELWSTSLILTLQLTSFKLLVFPEKWERKMVPCALGLSEDIQVRRECTDHLCDMQGKPGSSSLCPGS